MSTPERPVVRVSSPAGLLAVIPHLLGFVPDASLVVVGTGQPAGRIQVVMRYDLPDPPDPSAAERISEHAVAALARHELTGVLVAGYGPGHLVTPVADAVRHAATLAGLRLMDALRVDEGRFWSYMCTDPACCPVAGVPLDTAHPAAVALVAAGLPVLPSRVALAASISPVTGQQAVTMARATPRAERLAARLIGSGGPRAIEEPGLAAVRAAIEDCRNDRPVSSARFAWLSVALTSLPVRDDAWARMDPAHRRTHQRLWTELTRRALPGYVAAPACLLAFTAWQTGDGALAGIAVERALDDDPGYSMALLLRDALAAAAPPSLAVPPMTPEEVAASYADLAAGQPTSSQAGESGQSG